MTPFTALPAEVTNALGWALLHSLWQGALVAGALAVVNLFLRSARSRYLAGCAALMLMLVLPTASFIGRLESEPSQTFFSTQVEPSRASATTPVSSSPSQPSFVTTPESVGRAVSEEPFGARVQTFFAALPTTLPWLVSFWLLGVLVLSTRLIGQYLYALRLKVRHTRAAPGEWRVRLEALAAQLRVGRPVKLLESRLVDAPTVVGILRPVILLPTSALTGLSQSQLELILIHELAHIRRHDYAVNLLQAVVETLLFYHPAAWWDFGAGPRGTGTLLPTTLLLKPAEIPWLTRKRLRSSRDYANPRLSHSQRTEET